MKFQPLHGSLAALTQARITYGTGQSQSKRRWVILVGLTLLSACALETESIDIDNRNLGGADGGVGGAGGHGSHGGTGGAMTDGGVDGGTLVDGSIPDPECTPGTERTACPGTSCHPALLVCTSMPVESRGTCEKCYADSNCADPDHRCVMMKYNEEPFPSEIVGFCLRLTGGDEAVGCIPPFVVVLEERASISGGKEQSYCGVDESLTTCEAVRAFHSQAACPSGRDDECPDGGICRGVQTNGNKTEYRCTYACEGGPECSGQWTQVSCAGYCGG